MHPVRLFEQSAVPAEYSGQRETSIPPTYCGNPAAAKSNAWCFRAAANRTVLHWSKKASVSAAAMYFERQISLPQVAFPFPSRSFHVLQTMTRSSLSRIDSGQTHTSKAFEKSKTNASKPSQLSLQQHKAAWSAQHPLNWKSITAVQPTAV